MDELDIFRDDSITAEPRFVAKRFRLAPGDILLLYTDGLTEASTGVGRKRYDDEGALLCFAKSHSPTTPLAIVDAWVWGESEPYVMRAERARVAAKCAGTHASW